jgi:L-ascorbate metabolism protein UlaG (beta-lactamase superfamily)
MRYCLTRKLSVPIDDAVKTARNIWRAATALLLLMTGSIASPADAQQCVGMASAPSKSLVQSAGLKLAQNTQGQSQTAIRITFVGHATFLIESPEGVRVVTDYNDYIRPAVVPDIATMNIAHDTHNSRAPDPGIKHVLPGWNPSGRGAIEHDLKLRDVHVRNIPTNIRDWGGGTREFGNSIFVFEIAGLCIAHLGHLHHTLTVQQLGLIGQMDILLVPVDGGYTLDLDGMAEVLKDLKARVMIPMHMFSAYGLERFLTRVRKDFEVIENATPTISISRTTLPANPRVIVLPGR